MNYKIIIYILSVLTSTFGLTGLDLNRFFKQGHLVEARVLIMILILALSELLSQFVINFLEVSKIL